MPTALTERHRRAQLALRAATVRDLMRLWPALDVRQLDRAFPAWSEAVTLLLARNRETSASLAAGYLQAFRAAEVGLDEFTATRAAPASSDRIQAALVATTILPIKKAMRRGVLLDMAADSAFILSSGAISKYVLDGGRETVINTVRTDRKARGWRRVTDGAPCAFCALLAARGPRYKEDTAGFQAHGHCGCTAEPIYTYVDDGIRPEARPWADLYDSPEVRAAYGTKAKLAVFRAAYSDAYGR